MNAPLDMHDPAAERSECADVQDDDTKDRRAGGPTLQEGCVVTVVKRFEKDSDGCAAAAAAAARSAGRLRSRKSPADVAIVLRSKRCDLRCCATGLWPWPGGMRVAIK